MDNPNVYNDGDYLDATIRLQAAIGGLWGAGASLENIESEVQSALENCDIPNPQVTIDAP